MRPASDAGCQLGLHGVISDKPKKARKCVADIYSKREPLGKKSKEDLEKKFFCFKLLIKWLY